MYGLTRDFIRNGGSFMVLEKAEGLRMDELSRVQMGMLSSNQIPRLLPVHIREVDRNVTLQYDISGYKMLPQMLKSGRIKLRVLYGLLFQLADTFTECRQYMLDSRKLQIQEEYIFINGSLEIGELGLVYIPIVDAVEVDPTAQQFRELVIRLMSHVQELQGEGIQRVLQLCDSEQWDIRQLRELLLELYADEQNGSGQASFMSSRGSSGSTDIGLGMPISAIPERGNEPFSKRSGQDHQYRQSDGSSEAEQQSKSFQQPRVSNTEEDKALNKPFSGFSRRRSPIESSLQSKGVTNPSQRQTFDSLQDDDMEKDEKQGSSKTTYILLGCMIAMALVWRFIYMEQPGQTQMILSAALSAGLLGIAGWAWVTKGKFGNSKSNLLRKKIPNEEYADGELQEGSSNKRSALFGLGRGKDKQKESEEEMFQESWRWNASEMSPEGNAYAQGYTSQQRSGDMQSQSAQSERGHSFESRSPVAGNSRFQNLHIPSEASDEPFVQHAIEATAATSELFHHHAAADATVNLQSVAGAGITGAGPVIPSFYLERRSATGEKNERMDVRGASFVIGRSADMVQWVDSATGVSRAHVELSRNKSGYVIKDLGSVNGTILKGNVLAPYKEYPLEDGDTFTLAESVYTYRSVG
ncbi:MULTISPECIES: DUF6382 domain-containing protein [Paenibacillus]|uniref:DUF6382 domain-containing protein n=1 Tax=Paenibacillus TaxID=44249 RepID=UPI00042800CC|nr:MULTISPECIES: DUF6382 domain-containing protein [Paenibacillus]KGP83920.1 hypothetical protein P364_0106290 [Paenibacillus sp. MAEPY2]KGP88864.1 hypothetical protein P363_0103955 [Paenibacillus sp. MAEPY1]OZQ64658.1 hypothetical protein CA599_21875 [Paenibacillus taichungensis]HBU80195.1 FHA domain-containing protein [Paenibacillus sp.]